METPYEILGVDEDADDESIKKAYLRKVREFPPEQQGEAFRRVREAYEHIATDKQRRQYRLFYRGQPDVSALLKLALKPGKTERPDAATLIAALAEGVAGQLAHKGTGA
ncbi:J domain-containing protein [Methylomagnum sp.]